MKSLTKPKKSIKKNSGRIKQKKSIKNNRLIKKTKSTKKRSRRKKSKKIRSKDGMDDKKGDEVVEKGEDSRDYREYDEFYDCPICLDENLTKFTWTICCGQKICNKCDYLLNSDEKQKRNCPLCRSSLFVDSFEETQVERLMVFFNKGLAWPCESLSQIYLKQNKMEESQKWLQEAKKRHQFAADKGYVEAITGVGRVYAQEKDYKNALKYYEMASEKGSAQAQLNAGNMYARGSGVEISEEKAVEFYKLSASKGHPNAEFNLAQFYETGTGGVEKSYEKSFELYKSSEEKGMVEPLLKIGYYYYHGYGVEQNLNKAIEYLELSSNKGNIHSYYYLGFAYNKLNAESISQKFDLLLKSIYCWRKYTEEADKPENKDTLLNNIKNLTELTKQNCAQCGKNADPVLRVCGGCKILRYCSNECQVENWRNSHKEDCKKFKKLK